MTTKTPLEVLQGAREIIAAGKWTKGTFYDHRKDCYCVLGAIRVNINPNPEFGVASLSSSEDWELQDEVLRQMKPHLALSVHPSTDFFSAVHGWNDRPERTREEVVNVLDATISDLEKADA